MIGTGRAAAVRAFATLALLALLPGIAAAAGPPAAFIGFWEAIDAEDGARTVRSIVPQGDGTFRILAVSDYFSTCRAADGKGALFATGIADGKRLAAGDTRIECADGQVFASLPDEYIHDPKTDLLTQVRVGHDRPPFILHRISARAAGSAAERSSSPLRFVGFWEAIDLHDGERTVRSIVPLADGGFRIRAASGYFSTCSAADGKGVLVATGAVDGQVLQAGDTRIECSDGQVFDRMADEYRYDPETDLLTHVRVGHARPPFVLHRISPPAP